MHEERLLDRLGRNGNQLRSSLLDLRQDEVHGFHLPHAERAPPSANEAQHQPSLREQIGGRDDLAVVVPQFKRRRLRADWPDVRCEMVLLQFNDSLRMNRLRLSGNVLRDEIFALSKDLAQWACVDSGTGFFERTPFHMSDISEADRDPSTALPFASLASTPLRMTTR